MDECEITNFMNLTKLVIFGNEIVSFSVKRKRHLQSRREHDSNSFGFAMNTTNPVLNGTGFVLQTLGYLLQGSLKWGAFFDNRFYLSDLPHRFDLHGAVLFGHAD
jgi:hypothetical protein